MIALNLVDQEIYTIIKKVKRQIDKIRDRMKHLYYSDKEKNIIIESCYLAVLKNKLRKKDGSFWPITKIELSSNLLRKLEEEDLEIFNLIKNI